MSSRRLLSLSFNPTELSLAGMCSSGFLLDGLALGIRVAGLGGLSLLGTRPVTLPAFSLSPPHGKVSEVWFSAALGCQCLQGGHGGEPGTDAHRAPSQKQHAVAAGGGLRARRRAAGHRPDWLAEVSPCRPACPGRVGAAPAAWTSHLWCGRLRARVTVCGREGPACAPRRVWEEPAPQGAPAQKSPSELGP